MQTTRHRQILSRSLRRKLLVAACTGLLVMLPTSLAADTSISTSQTQNGGVFTVAPPTLLITHPTNNPLLTLSNSATTSGVQAVIVGNLNGDEGELEINGGSLLATTGTGTFIGSYGGSNVYRGDSYLGLNTGSTGTATVSGANSTWMNSHGLYVGYRSTGTLTIQDGGHVSNTAGQIGYNNGTNGSVTVSGANSTWTNSSTIYVGYRGRGMLSIQNGGSVTNTASLIGSDSGSNGAVTVSGVNSTWTNSQSLYVGYSGTGTLSIQNGGIVINTSGNIGISNGSNGTVNVSGVNSTWSNSQSLNIGGGSTAAGTLTISNSGKVTVANITTISISDTLNLDDGTLETGTLLSANSTSRIVLTGNNNQIRIGTNSTFTGGIQGTGGFIKSGPGTLTLNNTNTYAGKTTVETGTLDVQTSLLNNGPTSVSIAATDDSLTGNPILNRRRNINASYAGFGATSTGGLNTMAELLAGTNLTGTDNSVIMQVRQRTQAETQNALFSDVFSLTGMVNNPSINPDQTDRFVLRMSYDPSLVSNEALLATTGELFLATLNETTGRWENAVLANIGGTPMFVGDRPWNSSYMTLGQFGVDTNANTVWAVINHNSEFAVIPEPSTWVLGTLVALGLGIAGIRKRRAK